MFNVTRVAKNLIVVSTLSTLMVFWLGARFLTEGYTQRESAVQLRNLTTPETTLFNLADIVDQQRSTVNSLWIGSLSGAGGMQQLSNLSRRSNSLLNRAIKEIESTRTGLAANDRNQRRNESIDRIIVSLKDRFKRIKLSTFVIRSQSFVDPSERDDRMRMQYFEAYSKLIRDINNVRIKLHFLPEDDHQSIALAHHIKNAIWTFSESINQTSLLLESYLNDARYNKADLLNQETLSLRILQQHNTAAQSLFELTDSLESFSADDALVELADLLQTVYSTEYRALVSSFLDSIHGMPGVRLSEDQWRPVSARINAVIKAMKGSAIRQTLVSAEEIRARATRALLGDIILVLLCIGMAVASFIVARKVQHQADHDDLTQIPNRRKFNRNLHERFNQLDQSAAEKLVLITIDLNGFKTINDTMGHVVGDALLVQVAGRLRACLKDGTTVARLGGDEFAVVFTTSDGNEPLKVASDIQGVFESPFKIEDGLIKIDGSIGYSNCPDDADSVEGLQSTSDFAMYFAKQAGGGKIEPYDSEMAIQFEHRRLIETELVGAIEKNQLELHYQPQVDLTNNRVDSVEALIRWNHPVRGLISPVEFIEVAEETGLMPDIGAWVIEEACRQAAVWNQQSADPIRVAVNVSVHQIMQPDFVTQVSQALSRHHMDPAFFEIEITESVVKANIDWVKKVLLAIQDMGVRIALDDFGTGYSSLSQLQELPLDALKIDRSFISRLDAESESSQAVMATIASIAEIYGLETVAEGVESVSQLAAVGNLDINLVQGYYYSKPVAGAAVMGTIATINAEALAGQKVA